MLRICSSSHTVYEIPDERVQLKVWLLDTSATWAGLRKDVTSPAEALCGGMKRGQQRLLCHWIRAVWKRELGEEEQEIHISLTFCELVTYQPGYYVMKGMGTYIMLSYLMTAFFIRPQKLPINLQSHELAGRTNSYTSAGEPPDDGSYSLSLYRWSSNEKTSSSNELCQWDGIGIVVVLWLGGFF